MTPDTTPPPAQPTKVAALYLDTSRQSGVATGLILELVDGRKYRMNCCQDNCVEVFSLVNP